MIQIRLINKSLEQLYIERLALYDKLVEDIFYKQKGITEKILDYRNHVKIIDTQIKVLLEEKQNENTRKNP
jgi:hypothetical protein